MNFQANNRLLEGGSLHQAQPTINSIIMNFHDGQKEANLVAMPNGLVNTRAGEPSKDVVSKCANALVIAITAALLANTLAVGSLGVCKIVRLLFGSLIIELEVGSVADLSMDVLRELAALMEDVTRTAILDVPSLTRFTSGQVSSVQSGNELLLQRSKGESCWHLF